MVQNKTFSAKALQTFVAVMFAVITCFGFMTTPTAEAASGFYVSGTSIYDASGNKFVMRGVNIAHALSLIHILLSYCRLHLPNHQW